MDISSDDTATSRVGTEDKGGHPALRLLEADESVHVLADARSAMVLVTDRRLAVTEGEHIVLNIGFEELRRIQFEIERERPATLVIVPESPAHPPQVLAIPPERYDEIGRALVLIGS